MRSMLMTMDSATNFYQGAVTMIQVYSDPSRVDDLHALPNMEVFRVTELECNYNLQNMDHADEYTITEPGWYWWACFPGCLPDGPPIGPFDTEDDAKVDCVDNYL